MQFVEELASVIEIEREEDSCKPPVSVTNQTFWNPALRALILSGTSNLQHFLGHQLSPAAAIMFVMYIRHMIDYKENVLYCV